MLKIGILCEFICSNYLAYLVEVHSCKWVIAIIVWTCSSFPGDRSINFLGFSDFSTKIRPTKSIFSFPFLFQLEVASIFFPILRLCNDSYL